MASPPDLIPQTRIREELLSEAVDALRFSARQPSLFIIHDAVIRLCWLIQTCWIREAGGRFTVMESQPSLAQQMDDGSGGAGRTSRPGAPSVRTPWDNIWSAMDVHVPPPPMLPLFFYPECLCADLLLVFLLRWSRVVVADVTLMSFLSPCCLLRSVDLQNKIKATRKFHISRTSLSPKHQTQHRFIKIYTFIEKAD